MTVERPKSATVQVKEKSVARAIEQANIAAEEKERGNQKIRNKTILPAREADQNKAKSSKNA